MDYPWIIVKDEYERIAQFKHEEDAYNYCEDKGSEYEVSHFSELQK